MRRFYLQRDYDPTGVSGLGRVAEGVLFTDGSVTLKWCVPGKPPSTVNYDSVDGLLTIHDHKGTQHQGGTRVVFIDQEEG